MDNIFINLMDKFYKLIILNLVNKIQIITMQFKSQSS